MLKYLPHIIELRSRLIKSMLGLLAVFLLLLPFMQELYAVLSRPLLRQLPENSKIIATAITSTFTVPMQLTLLAAIFLALPYLLYQVWGFISPGLYKTEKRSYVPLVCISCVLFYLGLSFAYFIICPVALAFFINFTPAGVTVMTDIASYLNFMVTLLLATGCAFQIPIFTIVAIRSKIISRKTLSKQRAYVVVAAFVLGMLLTPPDVISQILLAIPMWLLFELGLLFSE